METFQTNKRNQILCIAVCRLIVFSPFSSLVQPRSQKLGQRGLRGSENEGVCQRLAFTPSSKRDKNGAMTMNERFTRRNKNTYTNVIIHFFSTWQTIMKKAGKKKAFGKPDPSR